MKGRLAHLEEMTRATEGILAALSQNSPEALESAEKRFSEALAIGSAGGPLNLTLIQDREERLKFQETLRRLHELTQLCLDRAMHEKDVVFASLNRTKGMRHFLEASRFVSSDRFSELDQDA